MLKISIRFQSNYSFTFNEKYYYKLYILSDVLIEK